MTNPIEQEIASNFLGTATILGTDWPMQNLVTAIRSHVAPHRIAKYRVTFRLCNGTADGSGEYRSRKDAMRAAGFPGYGPDPRQPRATR
jgi:hypothetical protein